MTKNYYGFLSQEHSGNYRSRSILKDFSTMGSSFPNHVQTWNSSYMAYFLGNTIHCIHNLPCLFNKIDGTTPLCCMYIFNVLLKGENSLKELLQCYRQAPCAETLNLSPYVDCVYFTKHMVKKKSKQASQP